MRNYDKSVLTIFILTIMMAALSAGDVWAGGAPCPELQIDDGFVNPTGPVSAGSCVDITCNAGYELVRESYVCCSPGTSIYEPDPGTCEPLSSGCEDEQFSSKEQKICTKYCETLQCDEQIPRHDVLRRWLCHYYGYLFEKKTGIEPPCSPPSGCCVYPDGLGENIPCCEPLETDPTCEGFGGGTPDYDCECGFTFPQTCG